MLHKFIHTSTTLSRPLLGAASLRYGGSMSQPQSTTDNSTDKASGLLALITNGLHTHAEQATALTLGDRSQYI